MIRVVVVDDQGMVRAGLAAILDTQDDLEVVGQADDGAAAVRLVQQLQPDVVLMDVHLPGQSGIDAIRTLAVTCPLVRVLVLSGSAQDGDVLEALLAGACGYLLKSAPIEEIATGLRTAVEGGSVLSPIVATQLLDHVRTRKPVTPPEAPQPQLTARELEVLRLMAEGLENAQIAERLVISPRTARNHVASILAKLQMENRLQAAVYAVRNGLA